MAPTALEKAEADRDSVKTTLEFLENELVDHLSTPMGIHTVTKHITMMERTEASLMEIQTKIVQLKPTDLQVHTNEYHVLMKRITIVHAKLHGIMSGLNPVGPVPGTSTSSTGSASTTTDIRLPRFNIPKFSGNLLDWVQFRDLFQTVIHNNKQLSDAQKLAHLKSFLEDEPSRLIKTLILTDANYKIAWDLLVRRYHNERELLFAIFRKFLSQPHIPPHSGEAIRKLIDVTTECIQQLLVMAINKEPGLDAMLLYCVSSKLDQPTKELWEQTLDTKIPTLQSLFDFLETRARSLSATTSKPFKSSQRDDNQRKFAHTHHASEGSKCKVCNTASHPIYKCASFVSKSPKERSELVKKLSLCFNGLHHGHPIAKCSSNSRCRTCQGKHHSLIHIQYNQQSVSAGNSNPSDDAESPANNQVLTYHANNQSKSEQAILATAMVRVLDGFGEYQICRAFLDAGSTASFVTVACASRLHLQKKRSDVDVIGLSSTSIRKATESTFLHLKPHFNSDISFTVDTLILPRVTGRLPLEKCNPSQWTHLSNLCLADPKYDTPAPIDILLGSDVFWNLLLDGRQNGPENAPVGINSHLGWLIGGKTGSQPRKVHVHHAAISLDDALQRFWEIESIPAKPLLSVEELAAESHFKRTFTRLESGRFVVKTPWKENAPALGESRAIAIRRFHQYERRMKADPTYANDYAEFIREYIALGHMELVPDTEIDSSEYPCYYIPHHYVLKEESTTTQFRVVFNGSSKTTSGTSINDQMLVGSINQDNISDIVMRSRCQPVAFTADIGKMYRQILLTQEDQDRHRIVWRFSPEEEIRTYRMKTVTYGTAAAPFLAVRCLHQLAEDERSDLPLAYEATLRDFYMDDVMSGADSVPKAIEVKDQLLEMCRRGQFELRKFASNSQEFLRSLPEELRESKSSGCFSTTTPPPTELASQEWKEGNGECLEPNCNCKPLINFHINDFSVKCLGIYWNTTKDLYQFRVRAPAPNSKTTMRTVLSEMSRLYDPLGWLSPILLRAKVFMQSLWKLDIGWDKELPLACLDFWMEYKNDLPDIASISIPRCTLRSNYKSLMLAGFCDASEKAYAAVVYLCAYYDDSPPLISLVNSKTRVAPARQISLPRLELCGAVLLSELLVNVNKGLRLPINVMRAWTDSTVVLAWIRSPSRNWKTFIANRIAELQGNLAPEHWNHVSGINNPADCASRGITPKELRGHPLWWNGPTFLQASITESEVHEDIITLNPEESEALQLEAKKVALVATIETRIDFRDYLLKRFSCFKKVLRVMAYVRRYVRLRFFPDTHCFGELSAIELQRSLSSLVKRVQSTTFTDDIRRLQSCKTLSNKSSILSLSPFLDEDGILRVGGRLRHSSNSLSSKHPMLLPRHHRFVDLLLQSKHLEYFHAGPQLLQSLIQQQFWILRSKDAIRFTTRRCIICRKQSAKTMQTMMGDLPASRVNPGRPFLTSGVDYAGPFLLKSDAPRSKSLIKAYLCIFVCFTTRAVHLEVASSLSTDAFIAALRRFVARRNKPTTIASDCGTNFVGAARELKELTQFLKSQSHEEKIVNEMSNCGIEWKFNPPGAPHFGGLWEAGVKSVKYHLHRILGSTPFNFEEMTTVMSQIESILNSRPLTAFSTSPDDLEALTPGHFLTGGPLNAVPQHDMCDLNIGRLDRWQLIQRKTQEFWKRWSMEYLSRLQQRPKWTKEKKSISNGDLTLIKDERLPPNKWKLGRVIQTHPGADGVIRVVTLKTSEGQMQRPVTKLCHLPLDQDND